MINYNICVITIVDGRKTENLPRNHSRAWNDITVMMLIHKAY